MPGAGFKRQAAIWRKSVTDMITVPYDAAKHDIVCVIPPVELSQLLMDHLTGPRHSIGIRRFFLGR